MDAQDKKSKDWTLFGRTEDNAIARAKYKREMGINPSYKTQQNAEVSRSAQSMKNPTSRPYDPADSGKVAALRKNDTRKAAGTVTEPYEPKRKAAGTITAPYDKKPVSAAPAASGAPPKPKMKPARVASDKSSQSGKMTNFQRKKARQFEKEGVAGRSMSRSAAQKKAMEKSGGPKISFSAIKDRLTSAVKPKASGKKPKPLTSAFAKKNLAANQAIGKKK
jgi:hypothetical protein